MWIDFINFILEILRSILIVFTVIFSIILYFESKGYSKKETKKKLLSLVKLFLIFMSITSFITLIIIIIYLYYR